MSETAIGFAHRLVRFWEDALGSDLIGAYLIGSLAHGGFSARYSDVDMAVIAEHGVSQAVLDGAKSAAFALSPEWGPKLSVFWSDRTFSVGRFPPLDRVDFLDHAIALAERERVRPPRPTPDEMRRYLGGAPLANWVGQARGFAAVTVLEPKDRKPYLRTLLYPARFSFSWITGRMGSNDEAVAFLEKSPPPGLDVRLLVGALRCRQTDADPDPLFVERTKLPAQIDACVTLLGSSA